MNKLTELEIKELERVVIEYDINDSEDLKRLYFIVEKKISLDKIGKSFLWGDMNNIPLSVPSSEVLYMYLRYQIQNDLI